MCNVIKSLFVVSAIIFSHNILAEHVTLPADHMLTTTNCYYCHTTNYWTPISLMDHG